MNRTQSSRFFTAFLGAATFALLSTSAFANTVIIGVDGLVCAFCVKGIEKTFNAQPETESIHVDMDGKRIILKTREGTSIDNDRLTDLVTKAGYKVTSISTQTADVPLPESK